jgi:hypothetical protein
MRLSSSSGQSYGNEEHPRSVSVSKRTTFLADLAYDLDFFEPDPFVRVESTSYYGHERLEEEIRTALRRLADLGIEIPHELPAGFLDEHARRR